MNAPLGGSLSTTPFHSHPYTRTGMSRLLTAPFDVVKIRFQLQVGPIANTADRRRLPYTSIWGALRKVAREEGVLGLWR